MSIHRISKIKLYNCYWCACSYCYNRTECLDRCITCIANKKPFVSEYCDRYLEDTRQIRMLKSEIQQCQGCKYKALYLELKNKLKDDE